MKCTLSDSLEWLYPDSSIAGEPVTALECDAPAGGVADVNILVTDAALVLGVRFWVSPADADHPYGHGKIEAVVTAFIGLMIAGVAVKIGWNGIDSLLHGGAEAPGLLAFFVALVSVVVKEGLYRWTHAVAWPWRTSSRRSHGWTRRGQC